MSHQGGRRESQKDKNKPAIETGLPGPQTGHYQLSAQKEQQSGDQEKQGQKGQQKGHHKGKQKGQQKGKQSK